MKDTVIKVSFTGNVNEENVRSFINEVKILNEKFPNSTTLTIYISSPGGSVDIATELFNFLKLSDCKVRTVNLSCVNSAAIIIFAADLSALFVVLCSLNYKKFKRRFYRRRLITRSKGNVCQYR